MDIKIRMYVELPYAIQLESAKNYIVELNSSQFDIFSIEFICNSEEDEERYNSSFDENYCMHLKIVAIYRELDYKDYEHKNMGFMHTNDEYEVKLPHEETTLIFTEINKVMSKLFGYIRMKTKMFWVESIPITQFNYSHNYKISYYFYSPNVRLSENYINKITFSSSIMHTNDVVKINESIFNDYVEESAYINPSDLYFDKASASLHERSYTDFIIYLSISAEAFIRKYIGEIEPNNDIIFKRLSNGNYDYLDQYYNILLKYLKGKSLREMDEQSYTLLKRMYTLRNCLMHNAKIDQIALEKSGIIDLNFKECEKMLTALENAINTIKAL